MLVEVIKDLKGERVPRSFTFWWCEELKMNLLKLGVIQKKDDKKKLAIVFVDKKKSKELNDRFRKKKYPTDVLSFESVDDKSLGELIVCFPIIKSQALEHGLTIQFELGYMIIHGVLHLLGYEHEKGGRLAKEMFTLQDDIFEKLCNKWSVTACRQKIKK